jgi:hypothetical protein
MPKAIVIMKVKTGAGRGQPDVTVTGLSYVHCSDVFLPGNHMAYVVVGTGAKLTQLADDPNFRIGQQVTEGDGIEKWAEARTAFAPGVLTQINAYMDAHGLPRLTAQNTMVDLLRVFNSAFEIGDYDVF